MNKITIKHYQLFEIKNGLISLEKINKALKSLLELKIKKAGLQYDVRIRLGKAIDKALNDFQELRKSLCEELSAKKKVKMVSGNEFETFFAVIDAKEKYDPKDLIAEIDGQKVEGNKILANIYDLDSNKEEFDRRFYELINLGIELDCYPIKLSKLDAEEDSSNLDLIALENFIIDDRQ